MQLNVFTQFWKGVEVDHVKETDPLQGCLEYGTIPPVLQGTTQQGYAAAALQTQQWHYHAPLKRWFHQSIPADMDPQVPNLTYCGCEMVKELS